MNKKLFLLALPAAAMFIAGCSKTEVTTVESAPQEITFQTVETKADSNFSENNAFYSYAFFLSKANAGWDSNSGKSEAYISASKITFNTTDKAWKNESTKYYWPKEGSLTFFAWTDNTASPAVDPANAVSCAAASGIKFTNYDITSTTNKNKDLLVADIVKDATKNTDSYTGTSGAWKESVPTVFKHILSNLVFNIKTDYATSKDEYTSVNFNLKSIDLKNVYTKGTYTQGSPTASTAPWDTYGESETLSIFNGTLAVTKATDTPTNITSSYSIVLPQTFEAVTTIGTTTPVITVVYDIVTNYTGTAVTETITVTKSLNEIYSGSWDPAKKYTLTLIVGLSEILWDPDITDWTDVSNSINI
jgi:uncharacterized cupin superfamily protein